MLWFKCQILTRTEDFKIIVIVNALTAYWRTEAGSTWRVRRSVQCIEIGIERLKGKCAVREERKTHFGVALLLSSTYTKRLYLASVAGAWYPPHPLTRSLPSSEGERLGRLLTNRTHWMKFHIQPLTDTHTGPYRQVLYVGSTAKGTSMCRLGGEKIWSDREIRS